MDSLIFTADRDRKRKKKFVSASISPDNQDIMQDLEGQVCFEGLENKFSPMKIARQLPQTRHVPKEVVSVASEPRLQTFHNRSTCFINQTPTPEPAQKSLRRPSQTNLIDSFLPKDPIYTPRLQSINSLS
jgi:hypothetical protein